MKKENLGLSIFWITQKDHNAISKMLNQKPCDNCKDKLGVKKKIVVKAKTNSLHTNHHFCEICGRLLFDEIE